ncbi:MAG: hypothetical protein LAT76_01435 [Schleiferiaceae bacterium]|nr:hypothetical protein [Schleiferiaceae bacterium]
MTEFFTALGNFFLATFEILPALGNIPNVLFILIGFGYFGYWMAQMKKHNQEAGEQ